MNISAFIAFLFGIYVLTVALRMVLNPSSLRSTMDQFIGDRPLIFLTGVLALMGGAAIVWFHNIWVKDWRSLVTLLGWAALIEGALMILGPVSLIRIARSFLKSDRMVQYWV